MSCMVISPCTELLSSNGANLVAGIDTMTTTKILTNGLIFVSFVKFWKIKCFSLLVAFEYVNWS